MKVPEQLLLAGAVQGGVGLSLLLSGFLTSSLTLMLVGGAIATTGSVLAGVGTFSWKARDKQATPPLV
jgi:hypothetical protein